MRNAATAERGRRAWTIRATTHPAVLATLWCPDGQRTRCNYAAEIENLDRLFALVLAELDAQGVADNTLVCTASDRSEMLGDHGDVVKQAMGGSARAAHLHRPGRGQGRHRPTPVATLDAGTFMDYAALRPRRDDYAFAAAAAREATLRREVSLVCQLRLGQLSPGGAARQRWLQYKYICCQAMPERAITAPAPRSRTPSWRC